MSDLDMQKELDAQELETIKNQLTSMGIKFHHNAKLETLRNLLTDALEPAVPVGTPMETLRPATKIDPIAKAKEMVRVSITCRNPHKGARRGEFFTIVNSKMGAVKAFIPYNCKEAEDCYIPRMFIDFLRQREYLHTVELSPEEQRDTIIMHRTGWLKEFAVVELGPEE